MSTPRVAKPAPEFSEEALKADGTFGTCSLADYKGKYLVLFFYPLDFTFVCPTEICSFSDRLAEFKAINCEVVGASVDSKFSHLAWTQQPRTKGGLGAMNIDLIADLKRTLANAYGAMMEEEGHTCRALFIIDGKGILRHVTMNDPPAGRSVDEVLRLVQAYQFTDEHGEVCPANWKPGKATIKDDPKGKLQYFEAETKDEAKQ